MNKEIEMLCELGSLTFDCNEKYNTLLFEPRFSDVTRALRSTVMIKRDSHRKALDALVQYINNGKHWSEYPVTFFDPDYIEEVDI